MVIYLVEIHHNDVFIYNNLVEIMSICSHYLVEILCPSANFRAPCLDKLRVRVLTS